MVGTIPVFSQQNQGRVIEVPIEICLPLNFPVELPIIWIRPDFLKGSGGGNIVIRQTENVNLNGMVWGIESLIGLQLVEIIINLQNIFGYHLPIVSAVATQEEQQQQQQEYLGNYRERSHSPFTGNTDGLGAGAVMTNRPNIVNMVNSSVNAASAANTYAINRANIHTSGTQATNIHLEFDNLNDREKLKKKVIEEIESKLKVFEAEIGKLNEMKTKLDEGETVLNREKMTLNNEINLLNKEIDILDSKRTEIERFISNNSDEASQRSATTPSDPASSQLLELLANESALMDALYQLIKATVTPVNGENRIPLNTALRCIRELSRKHFLTKAHIRKIT